MDNILAQINKPQLENQFHAAIFIPTKKILLKATNQVLLKTRPGLTEGLINKNVYKSTNTTMVHLHMKLQGIKSTRTKNSDTDLEDNPKNNSAFCSNMVSSKTQ